MYFLFDGDFLVYVGQSLNICSRVGAHLKDKKFDFIATYPVKAEELTTRELINIYNFKPKYNQDIPTESDYFNLVLKNCSLSS